MSAAATPPLLEWAVRGRPIPGELESGDAHVVVERGARALIAVIDGLGHGPEAATASRIATRAVEASADQPVLRIISTCHEALRGARGAVMSLAAIDGAAGVMTWAGVGNVEAVLCRADPQGGPPRERILLRSGVVGYQLPPLRDGELPIRPDDILVMATDGLRQRFAEDLPFGGSPSAHAEHLLRAHARTSDDALVLVARYLGRAG